MSSIDFTHTGWDHSRGYKVLIDLESLAHAFEFEPDCLPRRSKSATEPGELTYDGIKQTLTNLATVDNDEFNDITLKDVTLEEGMDEEKQPYIARITLQGKQEEYPYYVGFATSIDPESPQVTLVDMAHETLEEKGEYQPKAIVVWTGGPVGNYTGKDIEDVVDYIVQTYQSE